MSTFQICEGKTEQHYQFKYVKLPLQVDLDIALWSGLPSLACSVVQQMFQQFGSWLLYFINLANNIYPKGHWKSVYSNYSR